MHDLRALLLRSLAPAVALTAAATAHAQTAIFDLAGDDAGDRYGGAVAFLPDRDGDGKDEILVGVPFDSTAADGAGCVQLRSGGSGLVVAELFGDDVEHRLGTSLAACGDVDADGTVDFIAGAPSECGTGLIGYARVFSGATLDELHTVHGDTFLDWFGRAVTGAGDQDLDGHADFAVGAHSFCSGFELSGYVRAYSGATGAERWTATGDGTWDTFGIAVNELGDMNLDGVPDLIVGAPGSDEAGYDAGRFYLVSGVDGAKMYSENGEAGLHYSGYDVQGIGDADLDGTVDYAIGVPGEQDNFAGDFAGDGADHASEFGKFQIMSGASKAILFESYGADAFDHHGWTLAPVGDLDADGHPEVAAAAPRWDIQTTGVSLGPAYVEVLSTSDGSIVLHVEGPSTPENFEIDLAAGGDVNGDGSPELLFGSKGFGETAGFAQVLSTRELELTSSVFVQSAAKPIQQKLSITPGPEFTGQFYRVVGSTTGTSPGFMLDGLHVPLVLDDYTTYTLDPASGYLLKHGFGTVLGTSHQTAKFTPPMAWAGDMTGMTLYHVLVVFDEFGVATCVSPAVPLTIAP